MTASGNSELVVKSKKVDFTKPIEQIRCVFVDLEFFTNRPIPIGTQCVKPTIYHSPTTKSTVYVRITHRGKARVTVFC